MSDDNLNKSNSLIKVKSKYILEQIFDNLKENKKLDIIRYNKKIQINLNKNIKDYIKIYSKIEIEIIPIENQIGKFININKNKFSYCHIYFNGNDEEEKRNFIKENEKVEKIKIIIDYNIKSLKGLFQNCKNIKRIKFNKFNRKDIKNMSNMFCECSSLEELNLSNFNTNNVIDMRCMFYKCSSLKELNLSNFNTSKINDMGMMFYNCSSFKQ